MSIWFLSLQTDSAVRKRQTDTTELLLQHKLSGFKKLYMGWKAAHLDFYMALSVSFSFCQTLNGLDLKMRKDHSFPHPAISLHSFHCLQPFVLNMHICKKLIGNLVIHIHWKEIWVLQEKSSWENRVSLIGDTLEISLLEKSVTGLLKCMLTHWLTVTHWTTGRRNPATGRNVRWLSLKYYTQYDLSQKT